MQQRDVEISRVYRVLEAISRAKLPLGHVVICSGTTHASVADIEGVNILYSAPGVKGVWSFIPLPKPKLFVARISQQQIPQFFKAIDAYACVTFMIIAATNELDVLDSIATDWNPFRSVVLDFPDHLLYFIDSDSPESSTGITEAISVGKNSSLRDGLVFA